MSGTKQRRRVDAKENSLPSESAVTKRHKGSCPSIASRFQIGKTLTAEDVDWFVDKSAEGAKMREVVGDRDMTELRHWHEAVVKLIGEHHLMPASLWSWCIGEAIHTRCKKEREESDTFESSWLSFFRECDHFGWRFLSAFLPEQIESALWWGGVGRHPFFFVVCDEDPNHYPNVLLREPSYTALAVLMDSKTETSRSALELAKGDFNSLFVFVLHAGNSGGSKYYLGDRPRDCAWYILERATIGQLVTRSYSGITLKAVSLFWVIYNNDTRSSSRALLPSLAAERGRDVAQVLRYVEKRLSSAYLVRHLMSFVGEHKTGEEFARCFTFRPDDPLTSPHLKTLVRLSEPLRSSSSLPP